MDPLDGRNGDLLGLPEGRGGCVETEHCHVYPYGDGQYGALVYVDGWKYHLRDVLRLFAGQRVRLRLESLDL